MGLVRTRAVREARAGALRPGQPRAIWWFDVTADTRDNEEENQWISEQSH